MRTSCVLLSLATLLATGRSFQTAPRHRRHPRPLEASGRGVVDAAEYADAARIRTERGHDAAVDVYRRLLRQNPGDTSAAAHIAASEQSMQHLCRVGRPHAQLNERETADRSWEEDIGQLRKLLDLSRYRHASIREHIFDLPTGIDADADGSNGQFLGRFKNEYPMGPTYVSPLVAGQGLDPSNFIDIESPRSDAGETSNEWLPSLQCLVTLFLLSSCVPKQLFIESIVGGNDTLDLLQRLNIVFVFNSTQELGVGEEEWIVPLVHLFPLDTPPIRPLPSAHAGTAKAKSLVFLTDLHPNVLGMTSVPTAESAGASHGEEGAVMYIGPDSLALVHHLHASLPQYAASQSNIHFDGRILDVCTGSGVQALATLSMLDSLNNDPGANDSTAIAVDINERALRFTEFNAQLNGLGGRICTIRGDLLKGGGSSLTKELLDTLGLNEQQQSEPGLETESRLDIFLANPPFIPVPPSRSDDSALSIRDEDSGGGKNAPRYGLFSSGGATGEDCLAAIVRMAPSLLRSDGGLLAVVSEFMNPPPAEGESNACDDSPNDELTSKMEDWWSSQLPGMRANGILFTNQFALPSRTYAQRRAMKNDEEDINVWESHLRNSGIRSVSPGLLFVHTNLGEGDQRRVKGLQLKHRFVPKTGSGSIWTPHNGEAIEYTSEVLADLFS